jgi:hypothetical protein
VNIFRFAASIAGILPPDQAFVLQNKENLINPLAELITPREIRR